MRILASAMLKILTTELSQTLTELAMEAAGPRGRAYQPHATRPGGPIAQYEPPPDGYVSGEPWQAVAPPPRSNSRRYLATVQPSSMAPMTLDFGTRTSSKKT